MREMVTRFKIAEKHSGIAFSVPLSGVYGARKMKDISNEEEVNEVMWQVIYTVVNKGDAKSVIDAANAAGARGGRFYTDADPASITKRPFLIFRLSRKRDGICAGAERKSRGYRGFDSSGIADWRTGTGIIFVMNVTEAHGLAEQNA